MIETLKDLKHGKNSYESLNLERTASQILHHMEDKECEDSLESTRARVLANAKAIYGPTRQLDVISFAPTSSRKIGAAIVEHNPTGRSYIHCTSAREDTRLAACEHLLVITEDLLARLIDAEGISSSGWLPATPQAQHAAACVSASQVGSTVAGSIMSGSVAGSVPVSRRSSVQPLECLIHRRLPHHQLHLHGAALDFYNPTPPLGRTNSDHTFQRQQHSLIPRTNSEVLQAPKPVPVGRGPGGRVQWNLGSES
ncbi:hypothetical protein P154DRAFT_431134 [Amniculicola lignicola CBS 123094]|uniref:Uncharacterized protein n=1 Tax=Amniculicola lignicola CBS 123094 TaxID=1392246 RepID=A0A6A5WMI5_9PLEO|nr:hypothetical protein P154DRAFT_431134 [Amniculicola lignicola CBS 123094]